MEALPANLTRVFENVACTVCGCVCDDLTVTVAQGRVERAQRACSLAEPWFLGQDAQQPAAAEIQGQSVPYEEACERAAGILQAARSPLIYGLSRSSTEGQRAAVALADRLGATIDTTASRCHAPAIIALQQVGESTCTLGEVRNYADLVIYWGSNPAHSHPRHLERYAIEPAGLFVPGGRKDRTLVVVDVEPTETSANADLFVQVEPDQDFEALCALRLLVRGGKPADASVTGASLATLEVLAERMKSCRCGVVFFGLGLSQARMGHRSVEALLSLVSELNAFTRFYARRMRVHGDVTGADTVLAWQTGFPFSVNLARGYPRHNPDEFSAQEMLERAEVDACLLVGSEGVDAFSPQAVAALDGIPTIALDYPTVASVPSAAVRITTAVYGIHLPGTAYRMDEVPIPLRAILPARYPSDAQVLDDIARRLTG